MTRRDNSVNVVPNGDLNRKMEHLSVIIPVRSDNFDFYASRLRLRDNCDLANVRTIIVDDGSTDEVAELLKVFCRDRDWTYIFLDTSSEPFSSPRARNAGIDAATTDWVYQDDADMVYPSNFFQSLMAEFPVLDESPFNFITIPAIYLSATATESIWRTGEIDSHIPKFLMSLLLENPRGSDSNINIQHYAPASGMLAARKHTILSVGAYDEEFINWGGEDRDLVFRLLQANLEIPKPTGFSVTKSWKLVDTHIFEGWRSLYRVMGDAMARKGFYAYHPYHENHSWRGVNASDNLKLAAQKALDLTKKKKLPTRSDKHKPEDIIVGFNPFMVDTRVRQSLNNPAVIDETPDVSAKTYAKSIYDRRPSTVLIWNPYGSEWRLAVYKELLKLGIIPVVGERGALPGSIYFDCGGLCIESDSYREDKWLRTLSDDEAAKAHAYLDSIRFSDDALEKQAGRIGVSKLRDKLKIPDGKKILLAPLQLYDDTVTKFFSEPGRSYQEYIDSLAKLSYSLPADWVMVFKNHPLSLKATHFNSAIVADNYHINDLLEAASAVTVFNSGTGLIATAFEKPVLFYGPTFYASEGLHWKFESVSTALRFIDALPSVDKNKRLALFYYLSEEFYSFADMIAVEAKQTELSKRSKLASIDYRTVRIPGYPTSRFDTPLFDLHHSILFDVYRHHAITGKANSKVVQPTANKDLVAEPKVKSVVQHVAPPPSPTAVVKNSSKGGKIGKLKRDPYRFFDDSQSSILRSARHLFKKVR